MEEVGMLERQTRAFERQAAALERQADVMEALSDRIEEVGRAIDQGLEPFMMKLLEQKTLLKDSEPTA